jgi:hypothetical protein
MKWKELWRKFRTQYDLKGNPDMVTCGTRRIRRMVADFNRQIFLIKHLQIGTSSNFQIMKIISYDKILSRNTNALRRKNILRAFERFGKTFGIFASGGGVERLSASPTLDFFGEGADDLSGVEGFVGDN